MIGQSARELSGESSPRPGVDLQVHDDGNIKYGVWSTSSPIEDECTIWIAGGKDLFTISVLANAIPGPWNVGDEKADGSFCTQICHATGITVIIVYIFGPWPRQRDQVIDVIQRRCPHGRYSLGGVSR